MEKGAAGGPIGAGVVGAGIAGWGIGRGIGHLPIGNGQTVDDAVLNLFANTLSKPNSAMTGRSCGKSGSNPPWMDDPCYLQWRDDVEWCRENDPGNNDCVHLAHLNYYRCKANLEPVRPR